MREWHGWASSAEREAREEASSLRARAEAAGELAAAVATAEDREAAARDQAQALAQARLPSPASTPWQGRERLSDADPAGQDRHAFVLMNVHDKGLGHADESGRRICTPDALQGRHHVARSQ